MEAQMKVNSNKNKKHKEAHVKNDINQGLTSSILNLSGFRICQIYEKRLAVGSSKAKN